MSGDCKVLPDTTSLVLGLTINFLSFDLVMMSLKQNQEFESVADLLNILLSGETALLEAREASQLPLREVPFCGLEYIELKYVISLVCLVWGCGFMLRLLIYRLKQRR